MKRWSVDLVDGVMMTHRPLCQSAAAAAAAALLTTKKKENNSSKAGNTRACLLVFVD
jgi:hypothetical protein